MRRTVLFVAAVLTLAAFAVGPGAAPAGACSCIAPDPDAPVVAFEGVATAVDLTAGQRWTVDVGEVLEGEVPDDEVAVLVDADIPGWNAVSSCSVGAGPEVGGTYRFTVAPVPEGPFNVNLCSGSFEEVAAAPATPVGGDDEDDDESTPWGPVVVGGLAILTVGGLLTLKLMSRVALRSRP